ncbi:MAG: helix-turn-helix transcriptional regulator [Actinomycetota bacterium]
MTNKTGNPRPLFTQPTSADIAARLRTLRKARGWSLSDVEMISKGAIKAVVLGSYERSDRSLSVRRAIELANLYSVPLAHLLCPPETQANLDASRGRIMIDLRKASRLSSVNPANEERIRIFTTFLSWIAAQRSDWNGEVLSLRRSDLAALALLTFTSEGAVMEWLASEKLLLIKPDRS